MEVAARQPVAGTAPILDHLRAVAWPLAYVIAATVLALPALIHGDHAWVGNDGDAKLFAWYLSEVPHEIGAGHNPFVTDLVQYPTGIDLMWNTSVVLLGVLVAPLTLTLGPVLTYNLLVVAGLTASAAAARSAIGRLVTSPAASGIAGFVYGFSPALTSQAMGHLHILMAPLPPLVLLLLVDLARNRRSARTTGLLLGLIVAAQLLVGEEMLLVTAIATAVGIGVLALTHRDVVMRNARGVVSVTAVAAGVSLLLAGPLLVLQFLGPLRPNGPLVPSGGLVTDALSTILPTARQLVDPPIASSIQPSLGRTAEDVGAYIGIPLLIAALLLRRVLARDPRARWAVATGGLLLLLSMGPELVVGGRTAGVPLPWKLLEHLPLVPDIAPSRMAVCAWFAAAVAMAVVVDAGVAARRRWRIAAVALVILPLVPATPYPATADATPAFFTMQSSRIREGSVVLVTPWADSFGSEAMLWQLRAGMRWRMVDGEALATEGSLDGPHSDLHTSLVDIERRGEPPPLLTPDMRARLTDDLRRLGVQVIIVGPSAHGAATRALFSDLLAGIPEEVGGVTVWWAVSPRSGGG